MAGKGQIIRTNDHENVVLEWEDISPKPALTIERAAHELWERGQGDHGTEEEPIVWENLVEDDYLQMVADYGGMVILGMAGAFLDRSLGDEAKTTAQELKETTHGLGE